MFKIIYDTLVSPKKIANHVDEKPVRKFIFFLILMVLLAVAPVFFAQADIISFSNDETKAIVKEMKYQQPVKYEIKDGKLIYTGEGEAEVRSFKISKDTFNMSVLPVYIVFSLDGSGYKINNEAAHFVILKENEIELRYCPKAYVSDKPNGGGTLLAGFTSAYNDEERVEKTIKYKDLDVSFDLSKISEKELFVNVFLVGDKVYDSLKWGIILSNSLYSITSIIVSYISTIALTILLLLLLFRFYGVRFKKVLKICFLCCTPYVLFNLLGYLYNMSLFMYIGELFTIIYIYRAMRQYSLLNVINQRGGNF